MIFNNTFITKNCFNWCKEQHFNYQSNLEMQLFIVPLIVLILMFVNYVITNHHELILKYLNIYEETLPKITVWINEFNIYLLLIFFIYLLFFK